MFTALLRQVSNQEDLWIKAQGYATRADRLRRASRLVEPPTADPHGGWCGGRELETPAYPIRLHFSETLRALYSSKTILVLDPADL